MLCNEYLCNHILLQSGGGTWDTPPYTVRGVGSGSRDVDVWCVNVSVHLLHTVPRLLRPDPKDR
jgi:hypothetical protein